MNRVDELEAQRAEVERELEMLTKNPEHDGEQSARYVLLRGERERLAAALVTANEELHRERALATQRNADAQRLIAREEARARDEVNDRPVLHRISRLLDRRNGRTKDHLKHARDHFEGQRIQYAAEIGAIEVDRAQEADEREIAAAVQLLTPEARASFVMPPRPRGLTVAHALACMKPRSREDALSRKILFTYADARAAFPELSEETLRTEFPDRLKPAPIPDEDVAHLATLAEKRKAFTIDLAERQKQIVANVTRVNVIGPLRRSTEQVQARANAIDSEAHTIRNRLRLANCDMAEVDARVAAMIATRAPGVLETIGSAARKVVSVFAGGDEPPTAA